MLWDGTKFLTEKLVGAIIGQALKLLFVTLTFMLAINGFLALMVRPFDSFIDQTIYTLFTIFLHWLLCQNGPALATALLTGTPQLSMAEGLRTAASMAGAAVAGGVAVKGAASFTAKRGVEGKAALDQATGAAGAAKADGQQGFGQFKAATRSFGDSAKETFKSGAHGLAKSLTNGSSTGGGGTTSGGVNRFSSLESRNTPRDDGKRKTSSEFAQENKAKGAERYAQYKEQVKAGEQAAINHQRSYIDRQRQGNPQESTKAYEGGMPLGQDSQKRNIDPITPPGGNHDKSS
jgi:type IV secretion system protein TrbL